MNDCFFSGKILTEPKITLTKGDKKVVNFKMGVDTNYRTSVGDELKERPAVWCEAWDSGAEAFVDKFRKGDIVMVKASVRVWPKKDEEGVIVDEKVRFRVSKFGHVGSYSYEADE